MFGDVNPLYLFTLARGLVSLMRQSREEDGIMRASTMGSVLITLHKFETMLFHGALIHIIIRKAIPRLSTIHAFLFYLFDLICGVYLNNILANAQIRVRLNK